MKEDGGGESWINEGRTWWCKSSGEVCDLKRGGKVGAEISALCACAMVNSASGR
jgi:hypothetical protein